MPIPPVNLGGNITTGQGPTLPSATGPMVPSNGNWFQQNAPTGSSPGEWTPNPDAIKWLQQHPNASIQDMINAQIQPSGGQAPTGGGGDLQATIKELMGQGLWGQQLTDALKARGFQDNGLFYGGNNTVGFSNFYVTPDGSVVPRGPEAGGGAGGGQSLQGLLGLNPGYGIFQNLSGGMTPQQILSANPGYQFAEQRGLNAIDTGAAAKGTLLTGGNQKDRADYASGLASQNWNNIFGQQLGLAGLGSNIYQNQVGNNLNLAQLGKPS